METTEIKPEGKCGCPCHKLFGVFIALAGIAGLLGAFDVLNAKAVGITASILLILAGFHMMTRSRCKCCSAV